MNSIKKWALFLTCSLLTINAVADTVYCEDNKQLRCLGFEEKVVNRSSVCFDPLKCDQGGFVCKSELDSMTEEYKALESKYSDLANTHNQLIDAYKNSTTEYEELQRCITTATTLDEAKNCI